MKKRTWFYVAGSAVLFSIIVGTAIGLLVQNLNDATGSSGIAGPGFYGETTLLGSAGGDFEGEIARDSAIVDSVTAGQTAADVDQKIIKTGSLQLVVDSVPDTITALTVLVTGKGGFVQQSSTNETPDGVRYGTVTLRVPVAEFENALNDAKELANLVEEETTSGLDVTEQFTDLEARLRNAKAQEQAYLAVLNQATSVEDILKVQNRLGNIRADIEVYEGRIQLLENRTSFSTITIFLSEDVDLLLPTEEFRPVSSIREAAQTLIALGQSTVIGLIWIVIVGGGIIVPIGGIIWLIVWLVRRQRRGKRTT